MTAKKTRTGRRVITEVVEPSRSNDEFDPETEADVEEFLSVQSDNSIVQVYRVAKPGEKDGFLDTLSVAAILNPGPEQVLRDAYGPGTYRLKLKAPNKAGKLVYAGSKTIVIAERGGSAPTGNGRPHDMESFYREEAARNQQLIIALIANNKPQSIDFAGIAALMTAMNGGGKQSDLQGIVSAFTMLKSAAEPPNTVHQIKEAIELARSISPGAAPGAPADETDTSWPGIIKAALTGFAGMAGGGAQRQITAAPGQPAPGSEEEEEDEGAMLQQYLIGTLAFLKTKANQGKPVEFWIQYTRENPEEPGCKALLTALASGATFDHLLAFDPEIAQNQVLRVWFQKFYDGLKRPISAPAAVGWDIRDPRNASHHAGPGVDGSPAPDGAPGGGNTGQP